MTKRITKIVVAVFAVLFCGFVALAVSAQDSDQVTLKYYQGAGYYYSNSTYNPDTNLRDTVTVTAGAEVTVRTDKYTNDSSADRVFYGWFSEDGSFYEAGGTYTFTKDTRLYEAYGITVDNYADLKTYVKNAYWFVRLGADIEVTDYLETSWGVTVIDMNGHNLNGSFANSFFSSGRSGLVIVGSGTITYNCTSTGNNLLARAFFATSRHSYGDDLLQRLWVGKDVTIVTNTNLITTNNSFAEVNTATCPRVKIYGNVTAVSLMRANAALQESVFEIFEGSQITLTGQNMFIRGYNTTTTARQTNVYIYGGTFNLLENTVFYDSLFRVNYETTGGSFNYEPSSDIFKYGYGTTLNGETGRYDVMLTSCTESPDGVHNFVQTDAVDGLIATCTEPGIYRFECTCGVHYNDVVLALGHDYADVVVTKAPTVTETGLVSWTCKRCALFVERLSFPDISEIYFTVTLSTDSEPVTIRVKATDFITYTISAVSPEADYVCEMIRINPTFADADNTEAVYSRDNIIGVKVPLGITLISNNGDGFRKLASTLTKVDFSESFNVTLASYCFERSTVLTDIVFGNGMTINSNAFKNCPALITVTIQGGLTGLEFYSYSFADCANLRTLIIGASEVTFNEQSMRIFGNNSVYSPWEKIEFTSGGKYTLGVRSFARSMITELIIPDGAELIPMLNSTDAFWQSDYIKNIYIGKGTKSIAKFFDDCDGLQTVVLMDDVNYIGDYGLCVGTVTGEDVGVLKVYVHSSSCTFGPNTFYRRSGVQLYTMTPVTAANLFNNCTATTKLVDGESVSYPAYTIYYGIPHEYTPHTFAASCIEQGYDGYVTSCACGVSDIPYGSSYSVYEAILTNAAAPTRTVLLEKTNTVDFLPHTQELINRIYYHNGFDKTGVYSYHCSVCQGDYEDGTADIIYTALGYSVSNDATGISGGFTINLDALTEYNSYLEEGKRLRYGVIISNVTDLDSLAYNENYEFTGGKTVQIEITTDTFSRFGYSLTGFDPTLARYLTLNLVISAYVIDEDGNMTFIQKEAERDDYYTRNIATADNKTLGVMTLEKIAALADVALPVANIPNGGEEE